MKMSHAAYTITMLLAGIVVGGIASAAIFRPTEAKVKLIMMTAVRLGWICHDNGVGFDECIAKLREWRN